MGCRESCRSFLSVSDANELQIISPPFKYDIDNKESTNCIDNRASEAANEERSTPPPPEVNGKTVCYGITDRTTSLVIGNNSDTESFCMRGLKSITELWDDAFCSEIEFLEEVFYDVKFRKLSWEPDNKSRHCLALKYIEESQSWAFSTPFLKHKFVTNVLSLYKAYLCRGIKVSSKIYSTDKHPSHSVLKMTSSVLCRW